MSAKPRKQFSDYASASQLPEKEEAPDYSIYECKATGCLCSGSIGGLCRFHWGLPAVKWPAMTARLRDVEWMLKMLRWVRGEGAALPHAEVFKRIVKTLESRGVSELMPTEGEPMGRWLQRAESWIDTPVSRSRTPQEVAA